MNTAVTDQCGVETEILDSEAEPLFHMSSSRRKRIKSRMKPQGGLKECLAVVKKILGSWNGQDESKRYSQQRAVLQGKEAVC